MIHLSVALTTALALGALTPAKNSDVKTNSESAPSHSPKVIYVAKFSVSESKSSSSSTSSSSSSSDQSSGGLLGNRPHLLGRLRGGDEDSDSGSSGGPLAQHREEQHEETVEKLPGLLQKALIENLNKSIAPAKSGDGSDTSSSHVWVITGEFTSINSGSRAMQAGVGFGAGQSDVQVTARISLASDSDTPFLTFDSKGASGHMPGAVMTHNPYVAAAKFVMSKKEPEKETKKIAKAIAEEIGKFMESQGIPKHPAKSD